MFDVEVIDNAEAAAVALDPIRCRILGELSQPESAASLAVKLGIARQKINYHLRALEENGLVQVVEKRKWGGLTERLLIATAATYVVSPAAMGQVASDPCRCKDPLSARYLIALAARIVREVALLLKRSAETGKRLATLSMDTEIRFRSASERAEFTELLTRAITQLAARYHDESAPGGRSHRLVIASYPLPKAGSMEEKS
jgi:DNA-binding transcriptional ArsR family regulator